jgi:hypothetical protein
MLVDSEKKLHKQVPHSSEIGKVGVPSENFRNFTNTTYITAFNTDTAYATNRSTTFIDIPTTFQTFFLTATMAPTDYDTGYNTQRATDTFYDTAYATARVTSVNTATDLTF